MVKQFLFSTFLFLLLGGIAQAQPAKHSNDPVLFSVKGNPVHVSEFQHIYTKTNQQNADFSEASLKEYLDLYIKFKLKVQKARDMQLDTVPAFQSELDGYRRQLAASYLVDKEVTDKLVREVYEHMKQDVDISHIFVAVDINAPAADSLKAYNRALALFKQVQNGASFEQLARDSSDDKSAKNNGGHLGFVTAMLPNGYYHLEKAIYNAKPDALLGPIRTNTGYHVVKVHGFRPARGEMEVAQILIRAGENEEDNVRKRMQADSIYAQLQRGKGWDEICSRISEDKMSAEKGGYIGFFGINRYQKAFEDAAFALENDGDISKPVSTTIGWHIIKRLSKRGLGSFEELRRPFTELVKRDSRSEIATKSMIERIQKEGNFKAFPENLAKWTAEQTDSVFLTFKWKPNPQKPQTPLLQFGSNKTYTVADFEEYCARAARERMRGMGTPLDEVVGKLHQGWAEEVTLEFEESQLDKKYPEFHALMREYEEGMLLFDAAKQEVWDRANADSTGLEAYFEKNLKNKYMWDERARVSMYTLKSDDPQLLLKVRDYAAKKSAKEVLEKFNKKDEVLVRLEKTYEKGKRQELNDIWEAGSMTSAKTDAGTKTASFMKIEKIIPPTPKALDEARGYAVADYQEFLEKQWVERLRAEYPVTVNEAAFKALIRNK
ncbi:MAG: peptidylprolyl isomerase [Saprospiraceae bacterium]|nr:peptidylprolyl isomerase [Lewinellaceae bacterium]